MARGTILKNLSTNGGEGGVQTVTIAAVPADKTATDQEVTSCLVSIKSGATVYMNIDAAATSSHWLLSASPIPVPIHNLSQLHFIGAAGSEVVQILWRA